MFTRGGGAAYSSAAAVTRIPAGHPEGYLEAFATLYREAAEVIMANGETSHQNTVISIEQGFEGVRFVDACQRSSKAHAAWVAL